MPNITAAEQAARNAVELEKTATPESFTLRFVEGAIQRDAVRGSAALIVNVEIEYGDEKPGYVADLIVSLDEWDRIWDALKYATGAFERRGIALQRRHPPERM